MPKWVLIDDAGAMKTPPVSRATVFRAAARGDIVKEFRKCRSSNGEIVYRRCVSVASLRRWQPKPTGSRAYAVDAAMLSDRRSKALKRAKATP